MRIRTPSWHTPCLLVLAAGVAGFAWYVRSDHLGLLLLVPCIVGLGAVAWAQRPGTVVVGAYPHGLELRPLFAPARRFTWSDVSEIVLVPPRMGSRPVAVEVTPEDGLPVILAAWRCAEPLEAIYETLCLQRSEFR